MPAMTAVVVGAAGREYAGVASGMLNAARRAGGALGVALLGSLLGSASPSAGHALSLHVPLAVAAVGYLVAITLAWTTIRPAGERTMTAPAAPGVSGDGPRWVSGRRGSLCRRRNVRRRISPFAGDAGGPRLF
jgi:hypothetical protein